MKRPSASAARVVAVGGTAVLDRKREEVFATHVEAEDHLSARGRTDPVLLVSNSHVSNEGVTQGVT